MAKDKKEKKSKRNRSKDSDRSEVEDNVEEVVITKKGKKKIEDVVEEEENDNVEGSDGDLKSSSDNRGRKDYVGNGNDSYIDAAMIKKTNKVSLEDADVNMLIQRLMHMAEKTYNTPLRGCAAGLHKRFILGIETRRNGNGGGRGYGNRSQSQVRGGYGGGNNRFNY